MFLDIDVLRKDVLTFTEFFGAWELFEGLRPFKEMRKMKNEDVSRMGSFFMLF